MTYETGSTKLSQWENKIKATVIQNADVLPYITIGNRLLPSFFVDPSIDTLIFTFGRFSMATTFIGPFDTTICSSGSLDARSGKKIKINYESRF